MAEKLKPYFKIHQLEAGLDEAGRGCLAGPVFAAAVVLDPKHPIPGLDDSKALSAEKRKKTAVAHRRARLGLVCGPGIA